MGRTYGSRRRNTGWDSRDNDGADLQGRPWYGNEARCIRVSNHWTLQAPRGKGKDEIRRDVNLP
jgi:hypothetical protein